MSLGAANIKTLLDRGERQFARMSNVLTLWQAQAELFYPERADFTTAETPGVERYHDIYAGEPIMLRDRLANGLGALARRPSRDWFAATVMPSYIGELDPVKRWAEAITGIQRDAVYARGANFVRAMKESDADYVTFGTSVLAHTANKTNTGLLFRCLHPRDCAWLENDHGEIDEMHERIRKPLEQWAAMFARVGGELPREWREKLRQDKGHEELEVRRIVLPRERYNDRGRIKGKANEMAHAVVYACPATKHEIHCDGFKVFPYLVRRWMTVSGESWGRSPCTGVAMADTRILNRAQIALLESLEKAVDPPILTPHDGVIGDVQIMAGARINYDSERGMKARDLIDTLEVGDVRVGLEFARERRLFLTQAFYGDILKRMPDKQMTAFEAAQWLEEYVTEAAPVFAPMEAENALLMEASLMRLFDMNGKPGAPRLPEAPEDAQGREISYEFETPISIAHRKLKAQQADDVLGVAERMANLNPAALDNLDVDQLFRDTIEGRGTIKWLRPQADVDAAREERAQIEMAKQAAAALAVANQAANGQPIEGLDRAAQGLGLPTPKTAALDLAEA